MWVLFSVSSYVLLWVLCKLLGEDVTREGLRDTPKRVAQALRFFVSGYRLSLRGISPPLPSLIQSLVLPSLAFFASLSVDTPGPYTCTLDAHLSALSSLSCLFPSPADSSRSSSAPPVCQSVLLLHGEAVSTNIRPCSWHMATTTRPTSVCCLSGHAYLRPSLLHTCTRVCRRVLLVRRVPVSVRGESASPVGFHTSTCRGVSFRLRICPLVLSVSSVSLSLWRYPACILTASSVQGAGVRVCSFQLCADPSALAVLAFPLSET